jgi:hypothetical protein
LLQSSHAAPSDETTSRTYVRHDVITSTVDARLPVARSTAPSLVQTVSRTYALLMVGCGAFIVSTIAALMLSSGATAARPCAKAILDDWYDNDRIDRLYALPCYEQAIDAVPTDIRPYTDAQEVIGRAFQDAFGRRLKTRTPQGPVGGSGPPPPVPPVATSSSSAIPLPLLVLAGLATAMIVAGGLGCVLRRRSGEG